jgi:hypothetical protein
VSGDTDVRSRVADAMLLGSEALLAALGLAGAGGALMLLATYLG